jgi:CRP-like cAMP-binding protein
MTPTLRAADPAEARALLEASPVFGDFAPAELDALTRLAGRLHFARYREGEFIVREDEAADALLVIREGEATVRKRGEAGSEHEVNRLGALDTIGELVVIDPGPRSASVRAESATEVLVIPLDALMQLAGERPAFALGLLGVARSVAARLRGATASTVQSLERALEQERTRIAMGKFTFMLIVTYSLYTWVLGTATQVKQALGRSELVTLPAVIVTLGLLGWFMRSSGYPAVFFGLTLKRFWRHVGEALALTVPLMAGTLALKWWLVHHVDSMIGRPIVQMGSPPMPDLPASEFNLWLTLAYVIFVPLQELIYRGGLQSALEHFLTGRWRRWAAIFGSNIIFSAAHLYISPGLSVSAFVAGVFWGWLYSRQRALAGVSASHMVLGFFAFEVVDLGVLE